MKYFRYSLLSIIVLALLTVSATALAQRPSSSNGLNKAVRSVEKRTGGQVLSAEKRRVNGQSKYRIKVLTPPSRVRVIYIDAK